MHIELDTEESRILEAALENYLSNLREEIVKTEKYEWREEMHRQEMVLTVIKQKLH